MIYEHFADGTAVFHSPSEVNFRKEPSNLPITGVGGKKYTINVSEYTLSTIIIAGGGTPLYQGKTRTFLSKIPFPEGVYFRTAVGLNTIKGYNAPSVLDVGSGPGVNSVTWLKNSNAKSLLGIDFAEAMVEFARNLAKQEGLESRAKFVTGNFMTYPFDQKFDVAVACGVMDYVKDAGAFLKHMAEVTNKAFVASWPENGLRMALRRYRYTCPVYHYDESDIRRLHEATGVKDYEVIKGPAGWVSVARWARS